MRTPITTATRSLRQSMLLRLILLSACVAMLALATAQRASANQQGDPVGAGNVMVDYCRGLGGTATIDVARYGDGSVRWTTVKCSGGGQPFECNFYGNGETICDFGKPLVRPVEDFHDIQPLVPIEQDRTVMPAIEQTGDDIPTFTAEPDLTFTTAAHQPETAPADQPANEPAAARIVADVMASVTDQIALVDVQTAAVTVDTGSVVAEEPAGVAPETDPVTVANARDNAVQQANAFINTCFKNGDEPDAHADDGPTVIATCAVGGGGRYVCIYGDPHYPNGNCGFIGRTVVPAGETATGVDEQVSDGGPTAPNDQSLPVEEPEGAPAIDTATGPVLALAEEPVIAPAGEPTAPRATTDPVDTVDADTAPLDEPVIEPSNGQETVLPADAPAAAIEDADAIPAQATDELADDDLVLAPVEDEQP
jgi:hypothetical protein